MRTRSTSIPNHQKASVRALSWLVLLCCTLATSVFGQTAFTWTNSTTVDIGNRAGWNPNGAPSGATQDTCLWDGVVPGDLNLQYITGWGNSGFGTSGINIVLSVNQIGNVSITQPLTGASPAAGINCVTNNSPTAVLHLGDTNKVNILALATRPGNAGAIHAFMNNSANAAIMDNSVNWVAGGGVACVMEFGGTGDWVINHNLRQNNSGAGPITVTLDGPGKMTWSPGGIFLSSDAVGPITANNGAIILKGAGLCASFTGVAAGNNSIILNNASVLKYDAAGIQDSISRVISGTGTVQVNAGTLTLAGQSTYTGTTLLSGGELFVSSAETVGTSGPLGLGGPISFTGGTLGFTVNNLFDYSSRFSTAASQVFSVDTAGQSVVFSNGLSSAGGTFTKVGSGSLTLAGTNTYTGLTSVSVGSLVFAGPKTGSGNITVADSAILGVTGTGTQVTPATLTVGTSSGATLEYNNVTSTLTAILAAGNVVANGPITININSGSLSPSSHYPLLGWTSGSAPAVVLGKLNGFIGSLTTNGNSIQLNVTGTAFKWTGLNNNSWDTTTANNWSQNGGPAIYDGSGPVLFDDTATGQTNVVVNASIHPVTISISAAAIPYSIADGTGVIAGSGTLSKSGSGSLSLSGGANTYSGSTTVGGGILSVGVLANGGAASDIGASSSAAASLVLNGGTLQYTGGAASIDRAFTLGTSGGTVDASGTGALNLNNTGSTAFNGTGPRTLTLAGSLVDANTLAAKLADNGGATSLAKSGPGTWVLLGANTYSGATTIAGGTLQIGAGGASGALGTGNIVNNGAIDFNRTGSLTVSGAITGSGTVTNDGSGTVILAANNNYAGATTINAGTLQIGTGGASGSLNGVAAIVDNGTIIFNSSSAISISGAISGTGNLIKRGAGILQTIGGNTYSGWTTIDSGATLQLWQGQNGSTTTSVITNNGALLMMRQDTGIANYPGLITGSGKVTEQVSNGNFGDTTLLGTNNYTGGTYILGGGIILGNNGTTPFGGSITGNVFLTNDTVHATFGPFIAATLTFNHGEDYTFAGNIVGNGNVVQNGNGTLYLTGTNTYTGGLAINAGIVQIGTGGTTGSAGNGTIADNTVLVYNRSDSVTVSSVISGSGSVVQQGTGTLSLAATNNTYVGQTVVSNGTLVVSINVPGELDVYGGTLIPVSATAVSAVTVLGAMNIATGTVVVALNRTAPSNATFSAAGVIASGGTLKLVNVGPALVAGDTFAIFNQAVAGGDSITVTSPGYTFANHLGVDGTVSVSAVAPPAKISLARSGSQLNLSWPVADAGLHLQTQTDALNVGITTNWVTIPGSDTSNGYSASLTSTGAVFFRLAP